MNPGNRLASVDVWRGQIYPVKKDWVPMQGNCCHMDCVQDEWVPTQSQKGPGQIIRNFYILIFKDKTMKFNLSVRSNPGYHVATMPVSLSTSNLLPDNYCITTAPLIDKSGEVGLVHAGYI